MAIGLAKCMGYNVPKNFNLPYLAKNPSDFWKRWHISLSSWFQEYLYIPLGGNRKGKVRTYINLMLVMLISGLWHGASWTFVIWGAIHGIATCVHKLFLTITKRKKIFPNFVSIIITFVYVALSWVFFRAESFETALIILKKVFNFSSGVNQIYLWLIFAVVIEILYVIWCYIKSKKESERKFVEIKSYYFNFNLSTVLGLTLFFIEVMITIALAYTGASPFIYFQF